MPTPNSTQQRSGSHRASGGNEKNIEASRTWCSRNVLIDPDCVRATGFIAGQVAGIFVVWFSLLEGDPPLLSLRGWPLLGVMTAGVVTGSVIGRVFAQRGARRWVVYDFFV